MNVVESRLVRLNHELGLLINDPEYEMSIAQSKLVDGGLTKLILQKDQQLRVLTINTKGELVSYTDYTVDKDARVFQNFKGEIIQVTLEQDGEPFTELSAKAGQLPLYKIGNFDVSELKNQIIFLQDFICIMRNPE